VLPKGWIWSLGSLALLIAVLVVLMRIDFDIERRPWIVWMTSVPIVAFCAYEIVAWRSWLAGVIFGFAIPIEIWRTLPDWRAARSAQGAPLD